MNGNEIRQAFERCWSERKTVERVWDLLGRFVTPLRDGEFFREYPTEHAVEWDRHRREVYDSTAINAAARLAAHMGDVTPSMVQWFTIKLRQKSLNDLPDVSSWLDECGERMWAALRESNFDKETGEVNLNLVVFGLAPVFLEANTVDATGIGLNGLDFEAYPLREFYFEPDHRKQIGKLYRRLEWTPLQIHTKFGDDVPEYIKAKLEGQPSEERFDVIYAIYPRDEFKDADPFELVAPDRRPFGAKYIMRQDGEMLGEELGYYEMPAFLPRWGPVSGSKWASGPGHIALADVMTQNDFVSQKLDGLEKAIDPTILMQQRGLLSTLDLGAGGVMVVQDTEKSLRPFESAARMDWVSLHTEDARREIEKIFYVDQLDLKDSPAMTATEVQARIDHMNRLFGPTLGTLKSDYLDPLIERMFRIMYRAGELPEMPEALREAMSSSNTQLDIEYEGPIARAQKTEDLAGIERTLQFAAELASTQIPQFVDALDNLDVDELVREYARVAGAPPATVIDMAKVEAKRKQRQQQIEQERNLAMAREGAATAKDAASAAAQGAEVIPIMEAANAQIPPAT